MTFLVQHKRSGEFGKRPLPLDLAPGQLAVNYNSSSTGLFFRTDDGSLVKVGPVHVGSDPPYQIGYTERSLGEIWLDTTNPALPTLKMWTTNGWTSVLAPEDSITTASIQNKAVTVAKLDIDNSLVPNADSSYDLGSSISRFETVYANTIDLDGTSTIQNINIENLNITSSFLPDTDLSVNLGSPSLRFANVYTGDLHLRNDRGDWTVIEEENFLKLRNNKTNKEFKIVMEAIS